LQLQPQLKKNAVVVTIFPDDNKKYLSTDLIRDEPVKPGFLSPDVKLLGYRSLKRVCHTCCNPDECIESKTASSDKRITLPHCPRRP